MAKQKTICGQELQAEQGVVRVCTRAKDHKGDHRENQSGYRWPKDDGAQNRAPEPSSVTEEGKNSSPRRVEFADGLQARENGEAVYIEVAPDKILVDKVKFSRMVKAVTQGMQGGTAYSRRAGITKFGLMMGGETVQEQEALYRECLATVDEDNKKGHG